MSLPGRFVTNLMDTNRSFYYHAVQYNPATPTVTIGGSEAIDLALQACLEPGDSNLS